MDIFIIFIYIYDTIFFLFTFEFPRRLLFSNFCFFNNLWNFFLFRPEQVHNQEHLTVQHQSPQYTLQSQKPQHTPIANNNGNQEKMLSVSGKKKCSHCGEELGNVIGVKNYKKFFYRYKYPLWSLRSRRCDDNWESTIVLPYGMLQVLRVPRASWRWIDGNGRARPKS